MTNCIVMELAGGIHPHIFLFGRGLLCMIWRTTGGMEGRVKSKGAAGFRAGSFGFFVCLCVCFGAARMGKLHDLSFNQEPSINLNLLHNHHHYYLINYF